MRQVITSSSNMKRAALYVRVSTTNRANSNQAVFEQNPEVQERPLRQLAEQRGWNVAQVYSDRMSGSKADRPGLKALMADARRGAFAVPLMWCWSDASTASPVPSNSLFWPWRNSGPSELTS